MKTDASGVKGCCSHNTTSNEFCLCVVLTLRSDWGTSSEDNLWFFSSVQFFLTVLFSVINWRVKMFNHNH